MITDLMHLQERIAWALWQNEAKRANMHSVAESRTPSQFRLESEDVRSRWLGAAGAVIVELAHPVQEVSV